MPYGICIQTFCLDLVGATVQLVSTAGYYGLALLGRPPNVPALLCAVGWQAMLLTWMGALV